MPPADASTQQPLSGLRFAVKDSIDVEGRVSGNGSPAWARTHGAAASHAPCVQALLDAGAEGVGKTVMDELAFSLLGTNRHLGSPGGWNQRQVATYTGA